MNTSISYAPRVNQNNSVPNNSVPINSRKKSRLELTLKAVIQEKFYNKSSVLGGAVRLVQTQIIAPKVIKVVDIEYTINTLIGKMRYYIKKEESLSNTTAQERQRQKYTDIAIIIKDIAALANVNITQHDVISASEADERISIKEGKFINRMIINTGGRRKTHKKRHTKRRKTNKRSQRK